MHIQDLVPYLKDKNHHDFGHVINKFQFEADAGTVQVCESRFSSHSGCDIIC
jgi:hypothetical protein